MNNKVSAQLSDEVVQHIKDRISEIKSEMPFLVALSPDERKVIPAMDNARKPFVEKALSYGQSNNEIVPRFVDLEELQRDLKLYEKLQELNREISQLAEMVSDTTMAASSDAYVTALTIYNTAKVAAKNGFHGIDAVVNDLKRFFERNRTEDEPLEAAE